MRKRICLALFGALALAACSPPADAPAAAADPDAGTPADGRAIDPPPTDVVPPEGDGGSTGPAKNLALSALTFRNVGRKGDALRIGIKGADTAKATSAAIVRFVDENDAPVIVLDTDWDGIPDAPERRFHFDTSTIGQPTFTSSITIPRVYSAISAVAKVIVTLEDDKGGHSAPKTQPLSKQIARGAYEACDPNKLADRCPDGMSCSGSPSVCQDGVAPSLARLAYYGGPSSVMLFQGTEPDEDIDSIAVEFLDSNGASMRLPIEVDEEESSGVTLRSPLTSGAAFFLANTPSANFSTHVPKIAATAKDVFGNKSGRVVVSATTLPMRSPGQACDYNGFDACTGANVCAPGLPDVANTCVAAATTRTTKCSQAPLLEPAKGIKTAFGTTSGVSLWNAPVGCVSNDPSGRPESAVRLVLDKPAASLTITTAIPETDFDTAVYLLPGCADSSATALGCNDDMLGVSSSLSLTNVPAGSYTIIVESVRMTGGHWGVSIDVK